MSENNIDILNGFRRHTINNGRIKILTCEIYCNDRLTAFNPYVNEWKAELKAYRKRIQNYTESIKQLKSEIKKNQRFMNDIFN